MASPKDSRFFKGVAESVSFVLLFGILVLNFALTAPAMATFPGGNGKIAFVRDDQIWVMNSDGTNQHNITNGNTSFADSHPNWSADCLQIAFDRRTHISVEISREQIWKMNEDGSGQTRMTNDTFTNENPAWSPDGKMIAFESNRAGTIEIFVMLAIPSANATMLTNGSGVIESETPNWSPDGSKIAFVRVNETNRDLPPGEEIYTINPDGTGLTNISNNSTGHEDGANWFPDGTMMTFESRNLTGDEESPDGLESVYTMNAADGTGKSRLTPFINNNTESENAVPSPDGTMIAFVRNDNVTGDSTEQIYVMNADGSGVKALTTGVNGTVSALPDWQPACATEVPSPVGGEILGIDMTSLLVAGAFANVSWIIP